MKNIDNYIELNQNNSISIILKNNKKSITDSFLHYINIMKSGSEWEISGVEDHLIKDFHSSFFALKKIIITDSVTVLANKISSDCILPWSTIISRIKKYSVAFDTYYSWLWNNYIKDASFYTNIQPKLIDDDTWNNWLTVRDNDSLLDSKITPDEASKIIKQWNETTKRNYGLSALTAGFLCNADNDEIIINNQPIEKSYIINIPKIMDEKRFDTVIGDIKAAIFERNKPLNTLKDYLAYYFPTCIRDERYVRQILEKKNQFIGYFSAMICDRMFHYKDQINENCEIDLKITTYDNAAIHTREYLKGYGITYSEESIVKMRRKLVNETIPRLRKNFKMMV